MKNNYLNFIGALFVITVFLSSCSETKDPNPASVASFSVLTEDPEIHVPVEIANSSLNTSYYVWDFGDGTTDSTNVANPAHTYTEEGNYTITLRAYTEDGQVNETTQGINVGVRFLTGFGLAAMGDYDGDGIYIKDTVDGIDIVLLMAENDDTTGETVIVTPDVTGVGVDFESSPPIIFETDGFDYPINPVDYVMITYRIDSVDNERELTALNGYVFNPFSEELTIKEDGEGLTVVPLVALDGWQYLMTFEIR